MDVQATSEILRMSNILCKFQEMPDPRKANRHHQLLDILTIALLAVICGADGWVAVAAYGRAKINWLKTFLKLPHGIPSHDTFGRVFARLHPDAFESCFRRWVASLAELSGKGGGGKLVAIDGKSIRRSFQRGWDKAGMAHMVSAFIQDNHLVFGQLKTDGKGQEISAIEKLLDVLDLNGAVVSLDALGCQKDIAEKIKQAGGNYILQVKGNHQTLLAKMQTLLSEAKLEKFDGWKSNSFQETNGGHERGGPHRDAASPCGLGRQASWPDRQGVGWPQEPGDGGTHTSTHQRQHQQRSSLLHQFTRRSPDGQTIHGLHPRPLERGEQLALAVGREF